MTTFHDYEYLKLVEYALANGIRKPNRTGKDTFSVFGYQMRFNLRDGTIPMLTSKKMFTRGVIREILWYLMGSDNIQYLKEHNVTIWDEWSSPEGHLKKVYGYQWRKWDASDWINHVVEIPIAANGSDAAFDPGFNVVFAPTPTPGDSLIGQRLRNVAGDWFVVLNKLQTPGAKNSTYRVQFEHTLSVVEVLRPNLKRGQVRDPYKKTVFGQGCLGVYDEPTPIRKVAYNLWYNMMRRCYDTSLPEYQLYGGRGVFVDQSWRCFANFLRDIHSVVGFTSWISAPSKYALDKDYFGSQCYSRTTTIFLPNKYNQTLPNLDGSMIVATNKATGQKYQFTVNKWFAKQHGIRHSQSISTALRHSPTHSTRDWSFERITPRPGHVFRQRFFVDQIASLVDKLKNNPNDRRMLVSAWNVADLPEMALPPCHYSFQCFARPLREDERARVFLERTNSNPNDLTGENLEQVFDAALVPRHELSMLLNQRSCDIGLGVPFNIVQYSILLRMLAEVANMTPGEFVWNGGDVHIYHDHVEQLKEQLTRRPFQSPLLSFARDVTSIDDFRYEDFIISNYQSHPTLTMDVAV